MDDDGIEVGSTRIDLPTLIRIARIEGAAEVHVGRDTRRTWIETVIGTLLAAGVNVRLHVQG